MTHKNEHEEVEIIGRFIHTYIAVFHTHTSHDEYRVMDEHTFYETYQKIEVEDRINE